MGFRQQVSYRRSQYGTTEANAEAQHAEPGKNNLNGKANENGAAKSERTRSNTKWQKV
jgi:hypothetical protein